MDCQHVRWSMRMKHIAAVIVVTAVLLFTQTYTSARGAEYKIPQTVDMTPVAEEPAELYALSAVLMDGESGRVLYEKAGSVLWQMPAQPRCLPVLWHWRTLRGMIMFRFLRMRHPSRK